MKEQEFIGYEYTNIETRKEYELFYIDYYPNFGWEYEEKSGSLKGFNYVILKFKRNRGLKNKMEIIKLQRKFDNIMQDIKNLQKKKYSTASVVAYLIGILGTTFLAIATFSYLDNNYLLCILFGLLGFIGWIIPYFCYNNILIRKTKQIEVLITNKYDEIDTVCRDAKNIINIQ